MYVKNYLSDSTKEENSLKATNDIHIRRMDFCPYGYLFYYSEVFRASKLLNEESRQSGDEQ